MQGFDKVPAGPALAHQKAIVIGGGIAGCSTAYALAKRGIAVTLIERHASLAQEASGNPVAMLYPKFNSGASMLSALAGNGFAFTQELLKQLKTNEKLFQLCGQIQLAFNHSEHEKQQQLLNSPANNTHLFQLCSAQQASEIANIPLSVGGLYLSDSGWVNPTLFCQALTGSALIHQLVSNQAIQIEQTDGWTVTLANQNRLNAEIVVLCNANELPQFEQSQNIPITAVRGQVNFFKANRISHQLRPVICSQHYLSPAVDGLHSIGTSYAPNDLNPDLSSEDSHANLQALRKMAPSIFASMQSAAITGRVAWRSATRDYMPLAGQLIDESLLRKAPPRYNASPSDLPWIKGLYVNAGHGSKGMITAPLCGELIANFISGEPLRLESALLAQLNPSRFLLRALGLKQIAQKLYDF